MFTSPIKVLRKIMPARLDAVDSLCLELSLLLQEARRESEDFPCDLLLREMLLNAITHGCNALPGSMVKCKISIFAQGVQMTVQDSGKGFAREDLLQSSCAPEQDSGRGLMIMRQYARRFRFNAVGNCLTVQRRFGDRPLFSD